MFIDVSGVGGRFEYNVSLDIYTRNSSVVIAFVTVTHAFESCV